MSTHTRVRMENEALKNEAWMKAQQAMAQLNHKKNQPNEQNMNVYNYNQNPWASDQ